MTATITPLPSKPRPVWLVIERTMIGPRPALYHGEKPAEIRTGSAPRTFVDGPLRVPTRLIGRPVAELICEKQRSEWDSA